MKKIFILPAGLMVLTFLISGDVLAYKGDPSMQGTNYSQERHSKMTEAFEKGDYFSWKNLIADRGNSNVTKFINVENFDKFTQAHNLMLSGKIDEAKELRQELGLGLKNGAGKNSNGSRNGFGYGRNK